MTEPDLKFGKQNRLLKSEEFALVYKKGKKASSSGFAISWLGNNKKRLGLTVSSGVGGAIVRNKIKRRVREFFRLNKEIFPCGDIVVTARPAAARFDSKETIRDLKNLLNKLK